MTTTTPRQGTRTGIEVHHDARAIEEEWDRLALDANASIFARPAWLRMWWEEFGEGELEILTLHDRGRLRAVLPLVRKGAVLQAPLNEHTPLYDPPTRDAEAAETLYAEALGRGARRLQVAEVEAGETTTGALGRAAERLGWRVRMRPLRRAAFMRVEGSPADYMAGLSRRRRKDVRRRRRRLEESGELTIEWAGGSERLAELLDEGFAVEGSGWKDAAGTAIASRPETDRFYRTVVDWAVGESALDLGFVRLDGRVLAFQMAVWDQTRCYGLKGGFDPAFRKAAPGVLLFLDMILRAHERGVETVELLGDATPFELEWGASTRPIVRMQAFSPGLSGRVDWLAATYLRPLLRKLADGFGR